MNLWFEDDRLILTATFEDCGSLWCHNQRVFLNAWHPTAVEVYCARWCRLPADVLLATHLDFRDVSGRTWCDAFDHYGPPAAHQRAFVFWSSVDHPRFAWLRRHHPSLLR